VSRVLSDDRAGAVAGIGKFHIADLDITSSWPISNRQVGASMSTPRCSQKVDVLADMAWDINPECELELFDKGVREDNIERFFKGVDLYVDGLDAFSIRRARDGVRVLRR
jgi:molybdopterin/thiamine biosynthesis adenylyltransferase